MISPPARLQNPPHLCSDINYSYTNSQRHERKRTINLQNLFGHAKKTSNFATEKTKKLNDITN